MICDLFKMDTHTVHSYHEPAPCCWFRARLRQPIKSFRWQACQRLYLPNEGWLSGWQTRFDHQLQAVASCTTWDDASVTTTPSCTPPPPPPQSLLYCLALLLKIPGMRRLIITEETRVQEEEEEEDPCTLSLRRQPRPSLSLSHLVARQISANVPLRFASVCSCSKWLHF